MNARLVQRMSIAGFVEDIRLGLGKVDNHRNRLPNQPLNLIDDAALAARAQLQEVRCPLAAQNGRLFDTCYLAG